MAKHRGVQWQERQMYAVFLIPAILLLVALTAYPIISGIWYSLTDYHLAEPDSGRFVGLANFVSLAQSEHFWIVLRNTLVFVIGAVSMQFMVGFALALLLNQGVKGQGLFRTLLILPLAMTPVIVGLVWYLLYNPTSGLINTVLRWLGIVGPSWLGRPRLAMFSLIFADGWHWTPFVMLLMLAGLQGIPSQLYEAARIDGANPFQSFRNITLPLVVPIAGVVLLFRTMDAFKIFDKVFVLTGGGPGTATETIVYYAYRTGFSFFEISYASAIALVAFVVVLFGAILIIRTTQGKDNT